MRSYSKKRERKALPAKLAKRATRADRARAARQRCARPAQRRRHGVCLRAGARRHLGRQARRRRRDAAWQRCGSCRAISGTPVFRRRITAAAAPIRADLGWCEVPDDRNYNRPVRIPYGASHETHAARATSSTTPASCSTGTSGRAAAARGSAIFFHLARPGLHADAGCVAVTARVMARLLPLLSTTVTVLVVVGRIGQRVQRSAGHGEERVHRQCAAQ